MASELANLINDVHKHIEPSELDDAYPLFNSGRFGGRNDEGEIYSASLGLNPVEQIAAAHIQQTLEKKEETIVLDLGARAAFSLALLGELFQKEHSNGRLMLIATNKEQFSIDQAIRESKRRLTYSNIYSLLCVELSTHPEYSKSQQFMALVSSIRPIHNAEEVSFLEATSHRVRYAQMDDTKDLPSFMIRNFQGRKLDLIHEYFGGFELQSRFSLQSAAAAASNSLNPDGMILTHKNLPISGFDVYTTNDVDSPNGYYMYLKK